MPRAASQLSGEYCQGRIPLPWPLTSDQDDPGPLSLCVRFQVISRGGIVNGMVTQLWRIWSSQCLFFSAEMVQHQSQTFYLNVLLMFTNHRPPCWQRLNITDKTRSYRVSMSGCHYAPLAIVTRLICLICLIVPDLVLTHSPLLSSSAPRPLPHSSWHWPPLKPTLGPTQDREPNSSSENFTLITSLDNFIPCIVSHFYVDNLIDETRSIKSWKFKLTIIFRIPHWSHDAASTLEQGKVLVKMSRKLIDESFYLIWDGIPILLSVEN